MRLLLFVFSFALRHVVSAVDIEIMALNLVDAPSGAVIQTLQQNDIVRIDRPLTDYTVTAEMSPSGGRIYFELNDVYRMWESSPPYSLFGDVGVDLNGGRLEAGWHKLLVLPQIKKNGNWKDGTPVTVDFQLAYCEDEEVPAPVTAP